MSKDQYVGANEPKLDEIIRQAESRLAAQLTLAIAADQRAMTLASILATGAAALIAWAATHDLSESRIIPVLVMIAGTVIASGFALWSASPVMWDIPGNTPASWIDDIDDGIDDLKSAKAAMADHYADMIASNANLMAENADSLRRALLTIFLTITIGAVLGLLLR